MILWFSLLVFGLFVFLNLDLAYHKRDLYLLFDLSIVLLFLFGLEFSSSRFMETISEDLFFEFFRK